MVVIKKETSQEINEIKYQKAIDKIRALFERSSIQVLKKIGITPAEINIRSGKVKGLTEPYYRLWRERVYYDLKTCILNNDEFKTLYDERHKLEDKYAQTKDRFNVGAWTALVYFVLFKLIDLIIMGKLW